MNDEAQPALSDFDVWAQTHLALQRASKDGGHAGFAAELARRRLAPEQWRAASEHWWEVLRSERAAGGSPRLQRFEQMLAAPPETPRPPRGRLEPMAGLARTAQASKPSFGPAVPFASGKEATAPSPAATLEPNLSFGQTKVAAPPSEAPATPFASRGRLEPMAALGETAPAREGISRAELPFPAPTGPSRALPPQAAATPFDAHRVPTSVPAEVVEAPAPNPWDGAEDEWTLEDELEPLNTESVPPAAQEDVLSVLRECGANEEYIARVQARTGET